MPQTTTNAVIVYDDAGRITEANEAAARLVGIPLARLRGMHMRDFFHPDELPEAEARLRTLRVGEEIRLQRWLRCCDRRYLRVGVTGTRRAIGGYRAEYVPLAPEPVELPARLAAKS
jgi:PAS domain S-box-containing protein